MSLWYYFSKDKNCIHHIMLSSVFSHFFFFFFFYFKILYWFCHTSTCIRHGCTRVPHPELPSHLPSHTIPLGYPSAPSPSFLHPASNLDWRFVSYMILYFHGSRSGQQMMKLPINITTTSAISTISQMLISWLLAGLLYNLEKFLQQKFI